MDNKKHINDNIYKNIVFGFIVSFIVLVILGFFIEVWAKAKGFYKGYNFAFAFDPYSIYRGVPFAGQEGSNIVYDTSVYINNNLGIRRVKTTTIKKPPNVFRIIYGGGSGAWGMGVGNEQTVNYHLENKLNEKFKNTNTKFEVLNVAAPGYRSEHHLLRYNSFYQHLSPDMLILMDGFNGWLGKKTLLQRYANGFNGSNFVWASNDRSLLATFMVFCRNLGEYSTALNKFYRGRIHGFLDNRQIGYSSPDFVMQQVKKEGLDKVGSGEDYETVFKESVMKTYKTIGYMLKENGTDFVLAFQPIMMLREREDIVASEENIIASEEVRHGPDQLDKYKANYQKLKEFMPAEADKIGAKYIDMHEKTKNAGIAVLHDYTHHTPEGGNLMADIFLDELSPMIENRLGR
jgi:hypothetical protein